MTIPLARDRAAPEQLSHRTLDALQHAVPIQADMLINYDLPTTKDHHYRRIASIIGSPGTEGKCATIHFVVAGQLSSFRAVENFSGGAIAEMPVHAGDILAALT
jgi:hypothetical protein